LEQWIQGGKKTLMAKEWESFKKGAFKIRGEVGQLERV